MKNDKYRDACERIHRLMCGEEWNSDTLDAIREELEGCDLTPQDPNDETACIHCARKGAYHRQTTKVGGITIEEV